MCDKEKKLPVVSYSKITSYKECPRKYKFAYIDKLPRKDKPYTIFGQFCHEVLERFHSFYLDENEDSNAPFIDVMKTSFDKTREKWGDKMTKEQIAEAYNIMLTYLLLLSEADKDDLPEVIAVEKKIWAEIDDELILYGYIDRVQRDKDGMIHVVDYKTTKDPKYLSDKTQLLLYCYSLMKDDDKMEKIRSSYMLLKHGMKPMMQEHTREEAIKTKDAFVSTWRNIVNDNLFRAKPIKFRCNMCDFLEHCDSGKKMMQRDKKFFGKVSW